LDDVLLTNRILQCSFVIGLLKDITTRDDKDDGGREEKGNVRKEEEIVISFH
jgi:hypothetical protein